jgi:hypothetical protein
MPSVKDVSEKLKAKTAQKEVKKIIEASGAKADDKTLQGVNSALRGAGVIAKSGADPLKTDISALKAADPAKASDPVDDSDADNSSQRKLMMALSATLPTLLGTAFGGYQGGAIGAQAGGIAVKGLAEGAETERKEKETKAEKKEARELAAAEKEKDRESRLEIEKARLADREEARRENNALKEMMVSGRNADRAEAASRRKEEAGIKRVNLVADKLGNSADIMGTIATVEDKIGFQLEDFDPESGTQIKTDENGKQVKAKVDLPGVSLPGIGRVKFYDRNARTLDSTLSKVFNMELKDRSGAAVTSTELQRLREEFADGAYNTEEEKLGALKEYKAAVIAAMENAEARDPEAAKQFASQGGFTSTKVARGQGHPGVAKKNGDMFTPKQAVASTKPLEQMSQAELDAYEEELLKMTGAR